MPIKLKRVYAPPAPEDGARFLVDRLWPRGLRKEALALAGWLKDIAPSPGLRKWFAHDPNKWEAFQRRYFAELEAKPELWQPLLEQARKGTITLLFAARDLQHNHAVALKRFLEEKMKNK